MKESLLYTTDTWIIITILGVMMAAAAYLGYLLGAKFHDHEGDVPMKGNMTITSSVFALTGFLLAFTFSMAGSRYDTRRTMIVEEAVAISTAYQRSDMYNETESKAFKADFKNYLDARIHYFQINFNSDKKNAVITKASEYGNLIWKRAARLSKDEKNFPATSQMIPAINEMLDISTRCLMNEYARVPDSVLIMLFVLLSMTSFFSGYIRFGKEKMDKLITLSFCIVTILVISIILDLDRPRRGLIRSTVFHKALLDLSVQIKNGQ